MRYERHLLSGMTDEGTTSNIVDTRQLTDMWIQIIGTFSATYHFQGRIITDSDDAWTALHIVNTPRLLAVGQAVAEVRVYVTSYTSGSATFMLAGRNIAKRP